MADLPSDCNSWMPEWRCAQWLDAEHARCNLEINHPSFGWIPFTLDPADRGTYVDTPGLYAAVVAAGCGCAEYVPPTPEEVLAQERAGMHCTRFQFKAALMNIGMLDATLAAIAAADAMTRMAWEESTGLSRLNGRVVNYLLDNGHFTPPAMDDLFRSGMQVEM